MDKKFLQVIILTTFFLAGMAGVDKGGAIEFDHRVAYAQCAKGGVCHEFTLLPNLQHALSLCKKHQCQDACRAADGFMKQDSQGPYCAGPGQ